MKKTNQLVFTALFASLICVATFFIQIAVPATNGYIHFGDAMVILSGLFLPAHLAFLAAGIGSCLADLIGGYFIYVPITFLIKGLVAFFVALAFRYLCAKNYTTFLAPLCGLFDLFFVVIGYALFETVLYGFSAALLAIPANCVQAISGIVLSTIFYGVLNRIPEVKQLKQRVK